MTSDLVLKALLEYRNQDAGHQSPGSLDAPIGEVYKLIVREFSLAVSSIGR
jgi:hypothetical protein